jgi:biopolymer transport protein ExbD
MAIAEPSEDGEIVGINVTPLVDITLVLLIVFMVTAKLITQQGIPLDLPKAATAGATHTVLTISVDAEGRVFANGRPVETTAIPPLASAALRENPDLRTVVQAAGGARHDRVLGVVDALRSGGVVKIAFAADPARHDHDREPTRDPGPR